jgi:solute carrier family 7 (L-type amino acid transporter), member 9/15
MIGIATVSALWAYDGANNVTNIAEEIINPEKNLPISLILGVTVVIVAYLLVNISYLCVLTAEQVMTSPAVAVDMANVVLGSVGEVVIGLLVSISALGSLNGSIFSGGRSFYASARDGLFIFPTYVAHLSNFSTPWVALLIQMVVAIIYLFLGDLQTLVNYFGFTAWIFYSFIGVALVRLRYTKKDLPRPFRLRPSPLIPIVFFIVAWFIVITTLIQDPVPSCVSLVFIVIGVPVYFVIIYMNKRRLLSRESQK